MQLFLFILIYFFTSLNAQQCLGAELRTIDSYTYGRFEVRMKPATGDGYVSSFFTYHDFWGTSYNGAWQTYINEVDIDFTGENTGYESITRNELITFAFSVSNLGLILSTMVKSESLFNLFEALYNPE